MSLPFTQLHAVWTDQASTATASLPDDMTRRCPTKVIEVTTTGFSGTLDIKGRIHPTATASNVTYFLAGQGAAHLSSTAQLSWTLSTAVTRYIVVEPYMDMNLVMTRSAGSITVTVGGWGLMANLDTWSALRAKDSTSADTELVATTANGLKVGQTSVGVASADGVNNTVSFFADAAGSNVRNLVRQEVYNGTTWDRLRGDATDGLDVDVTRLPVAQFGEVQATPTANTLLGRLKDLLTGIVLSAGTAIIGKVGIDQTTPGTTNAVVLKAKETVSGDYELLASAYGLRVALTQDSQAMSDARSNTIAMMSDRTGVLQRLAVRPEVMNPNLEWDRMRSIAASGAGLGVQQVGTLGELITLAASAARTDSANGTAVTGLGWRNRYIVLFDLTVADTDAGDTLDVYVDVSLDGTTWLNAIHFTQIIGTDSASKRYAVLDPSAPGTAEILVTSDAAAGVVRPSMFGPQMRARWAITDAGTDDASFTFSVSAYAL